MSTNTLNVRIQEKYDIEANWIAKNPVLLKGEVAYSSDKNNAYKVGDGTSTWSGLTYTKGFGKVKVGEVTIESGQNNDTLTMVGGSNITITPNTGTNTVTVATSAEANVINTVKVNNTALTPTNKAVDITITTSDSKNGIVTVNGSDKTVYTHPTTAGNKHIPTNGASGNTLRWSSSGTAVWESVDTTPTASSTRMITSGGVKTALDNKVDKTTVSAEGIAETTATITVPAKAKAVAVQKMYGKTVKITPESGDPYLANAANESVVSVGRNIYPDAFNGYTITTGGKTKSVPIKVEAGTYTITGKYTTVNYLDGYTEVQFRDDSDAVVKHINNGSSNNITFTADEASRITKSTIYINAAIVGRTFKYIQMIKGTDASASVYTPYFKHTAEIPISLTSLDGYGCSLTKTDSTTITNVIDFENGIYTQPVGVMKLKDLTWKYRNDGTGYAPYFYTEFGTSVIKVNGTITNQQNVVMGKYPTVGRTSPTVFTDKTMCADGGSSGVSQIQIKDSSYTDAETFKKSLSGQILLYEKYTTETKDISDIIRPLKVESGGTVTFVNEHNIDCDTVVKYKKEV